MACTPRHISAFTVLLAVSVVIGCSDTATSVPRAKTPQRRIVCLSPALTQMLTDLGLGNGIVGVGEIDPVAPPHAHPVGHFRQLDHEKLLAINPTDLVMQNTKKEPLTETLRGLAETHGWHVWRFELETREDVLETLPKLGRAMGVEAEGVTLAEHLRGQMRRLEALTGSLDRQRVLLVVDAEPQVMAAAPGTYLDSLLAAAGGVNVIEDSSVLYPELDAERVLALKPTVVLHLRMPGSTQRVTLPPGLDARVETLEDAAALLPSSSMSRIAAKIAGRLHPDQAGGIDRVMSEPKP